MKKLLLLIGLIVVLNTNVIAETKIIKNKQFKKIGVVEVLEGRAFQQYLNNKWKKIHYEPLALGDPIYQGTLIETKEEDVKFGIVFDDNTTLTLEGPSQIFVGVMNYSPGDLDSYFWMSIYYGKFAIESGEIAKIYDGAMEIDLPNATLGINGTTLIGYVPPNKETSTNKKLHEKNIVILLEDSDGQVGEVIVSNDKGNFVLSNSNESSVIDKKGNQTLSDTSNQANEAALLVSVNELLQDVVVQKLNTDEEVLKKMVASQKKLKKLDDLNDDGKISVEDENLFIEQMRETKQTRIELDQKIKNIKDLGKEEFLEAKQELDQFKIMLVEAEASGNTESIKIAQDNLLESEEYFIQTKKEIRTARQDAIFEASSKNREINEELLGLIEAEEKNVLGATVEFYKIKKSKKKEKKQAIVIIDQAKKQLNDLKSELNTQAILQLNNFVEEYKQYRQANMEALQEQRRTMIQENRSALIELKNAEENLKKAHESGDTIQIELAKKQVVIKEQIKQEKFEPVTVKAEINVMDIVGLGQQALDEFLDAQEKTASLAKTNTELLQKEQLKAKEEYEKKLQVLDQAYKQELQRISSGAQQALVKKELNIMDFQDPSTYEEFLNPGVGFAIQEIKDQFSKEENRVGLEATRVGAYGGAGHTLTIAELKSKEIEAITQLNVQAVREAQQLALESSQIGISQETFEAQVNSYMENVEELVIKRMEEEFARQKSELENKAENDPWGGTGLKDSIAELNYQKEQSIGLMKSELWSEAQKQALENAEKGKQLQIQKQQLEIQTQIQAEKDQALIDQVEALKQAQAQAEERARINAQVLLQAETEYNQKLNAIQEIQKSAIKQEIVQQKEEQKAELKEAKEERKKEIQQAKENKMGEMMEMMGQGMGPEGMMGSGMVESMSSGESGSGLGSIMMGSGMVGGESGSGLGSIMMDSGPSEMSSGGMESMSSGGEGSGMSGSSSESSGGMSGGMSGG